MTIRDCYENCLIELNKVQAPSILLDDFIYFFNKAVLQYVNSRYNVFETKLQITDDLRVLLKTQKLTEYNQLGNTETFGGNYTFQLPDDYLHILNCICEFEDKKPVCGKNETFQVGANKLDTSQWSHVINNYYMKPSVKRPYYYMINLSEPTINEELNNSDYKRNQLTGYDSAVRYGNATLPFLLIKCGNDNRYELKAIYIDYLRSPKYLSLDEEQLDSVEDNTQVIEFPDYVVYEIINLLVTLCMENGSNPRLQSNIPINKSIL